MPDEPVFEPERRAADVGEVLKTQLPLALTELLLSAAMVGVYGLLGKFAGSVWLGALVGTAAALVNHGVMILTLLKAEGAEDPAKGRLRVQGSYMLRMLVLIAVLILALKSGRFDPLATVLPLCFMRVAIFISGLLTKGKGRDANG